MATAQAYANDGRVSSPNGVDRVDLLIADDEPIVRRILEMALQSSGLRVRTAINGADAVRLYRRYRDTIRLVLLDVQMPELDGPQAMQALREIDPDVRVMFMSGCCGTYGVRDLLEMGALGFMEKPFHDMNAAVAQIRKLATAPIAQVI